MSFSGISPDPSNVEAIKSWPRPTTITRLKVSLDMCCVVTSFVDMADSLPQCTATSPFVWSQQSEEAFQKLKMALTNPQNLAYPDPDAMFALDTNGSNTGIVAMLSQQCACNKQERVIAYFSWALSSTDVTYLKRTVGSSSVNETFSEIGLYTFHAC